MASSSASPAAPFLAQRYRLERRIAQGGMAEVWLATDTQLTRQVAVKVLKPALAADPVIAERFRREAIAVAGLTHPNIVAVYDTVDERGRQAVVMQYVPGRSLRQILDEERTLSPEMTMQIGSSVAGALDAAHRAGLVHRDVKPGNILVTPEGRVLLTDFGIAKAASGEGDLTSDNVMMGTAKYLSPEQVRGRRLDGRADLYSLGLVLYECLAGRPPFLGDNDAATALARLRRDPTPLLRLRPTLPAGLGELIHRMLARNPDERPSTGSAIQGAIERIRSAPGDPTSPTPVPGTPMRDGPSTPRDGTRRPAGNTGPTSRPSTPVRPRPVVDRDPTPSAGRRVTGRPARQFQQRRTPAMVVGGLLLAAVVLTALLVAVLGDDRPTGETGPAPAPNGAAPGDTEATTPPPAPAGPVTIVKAEAYDPNGDDGDEHNAEAPNAIDGSDTTSWRTDCYDNQYLGAKGGVGLVVELSGAATGTLEVTFGAIPWAATIFTADEIAPALGGWGSAADQRFSMEKPSATFTLGPDAHRFALVWLTQLAPDPTCSAARPFRGKISEIHFLPA